MFALRHAWSETLSQRRLGRYLGRIALSVSINDPLRLLLPLLLLVLLLLLELALTALALLPLLLGLLPLELAAPAPLLLLPLLLLLALLLLLLAEGVLAAAEEGGSIDSCLIGGNCALDWYSIHGCV